LKFSKCSEEGIDIEDACAELFPDAAKCKYIFAKGIGMEKMFLNSCKVQESYCTPELRVPVLDLFDMDGLNIKTENLEQYPSCGKHERSPDDKLLHCSLSEIYCFYNQLVAFLA
jgi:hypothetical protein